MTVKDGTVVAKTETVDDSTATSKAITGLTAGTAYTVAVVTVNSNGDESADLPGTFSTSELLLILNMYVVFV